MDIKGKGGGGGGRGGGGGDVNDTQFVLRTSMLHASAFICRSKFVNLLSCKVDLTVRFEMSFSIVCNFGSVGTMKSVLRSSD